MTVVRPPRGEGLRLQFLPARSDLRLEADWLVLICLICSKKLLSTGKDKARIQEMMT